MSEECQLRVGSRERETGGGNWVRRDIRDRIAVQHDDFTGGRVEAPVFARFALIAIHRDVAERNPVVKGSYGVAGLMYFDVSLEGVFAAALPDQFLHASKPCITDRCWATA